MLYNINTQQRVTESFFRLQNPNTSFPAQLTDEVLADYGFVNLNYPEEPTPDAGFKIVEDGQELVNGTWTVKYTQVVLNTDELEEFTQLTRNQRNARLARSDWTQLPDAPLTTEQKTAWSVYRQSLRDVTAQSGFPTNVIWPTQP